MNALYPDARTWAEQHSLANVPRLARLEGFAFQAHPEIVEAFGEEGRSMARVARSSRRTPAGRAGGALLVVLGVVALIAPILGVAVYGDAPAYLAPTAEPLPAEIAVPVSGVCFAIAALTQIFAWVAWVRAGARWSALLLGLAVATAVLAGFA